jgi:hypothetical protein
MNSDLKFINLNLQFSNCIPLENSKQSPFTYELGFQAQNTPSLAQNNNLSSLFRSAFQSFARLFPVCTAA